jgi:hypothetical protein
MKHENAEVVGTDMEIRQISAPTPLPEYLENI